MALIHSGQLMPDPDASSMLDDSAEWGEFERVVMEALQPGRLADFCPKGVRSSMLLRLVDVRLLEDTKKNRNRALRAMQMGEGGGIGREGGDEGSVGGEGGEDGGGGAGAARERVKSEEGKGDARGTEERTVGGKEEKREETMASSVVQASDGVPDWMKANAGMGLEAAVDAGTQSVRLMASVSDGVEGEMENEQELGRVRVKQDDGGKYLLMSNADL
jgi:hypothetical protein